MYTFQAFTLLPVTKSQLYCEVYSFLYTFRGYFPKGGGHVIINVNPVEKCIKPLELLNAGDVVQIKGKSFVAGVLPIKVSKKKIIIW